MISLISGIEPRKYNTMEQADGNHNVTKHAQMPVPQPPIETKEDKVTLSHRGKAQLLKNKGWSINEIATIMSLDVKTITSYIW